MAKRPSDNLVKVHSPYGHSYWLDVQCNGGWRTIAVTDPSHVRSLREDAECVRQCIDEAAKTWSDDHGNG